ncbi:MAG: DUF2339 domain-containing protein, partial [Bauldia litoralis]
PEQRIFTASYSLMERGLQSIAWLAAALGLIRLSRSYSSPVVAYGWRVLLWLGIGNATIFGVLLSLPVVSVALDGPLFVGTWPLLNILALVYGVPALLCAALFAMFRQGEETKAWARLVGAVSLLLAFVWVSYEVQRAFQGGYLWRGPTSDAEWYTYSAVWLLCSLGLLALAIWRGSSSLRHASLIFVIVSVLKVFLFDMSALTGLYRALSFIGLGLCLIAIGYFYQVFVYGKSRTKNPGPAEEEAPG